MDSSSYIYIRPTSVEMALERLRLRREKYLRDRQKKQRTPPLHRIDEEDKPTHKFRAKTSRKRTPKTRKSPKKTRKSPKKTRKSPKKTRKF